MVCIEERSPLTFANTKQGILKQLFVRINSILDRCYGLQKSMLSEWCYYKGMYYKRGFSLIGGN